MGEMEGTNGLLRTYFVRKASFLASVTDSWVCWGIQALEAAAAVVVIGIVKSKCAFVHKV